MDFDDDAPPDLVETGTAPEVELPPSERQIKVPITIVTGYLGSGKTTLLNYILTAQHGKKIAVIMNALDIEKSLTVNKGNEQVEEWLEVGNGCICCSVKDTGVNAIESLMEKKGAFDYILLETTGLADPGNLALCSGSTTAWEVPSTWTVSLDDPTGKIEIDEDHKEDDHHGHGPLMTTAHVQISHADVIVINKSDLVSEEELKQVKARIESINGIAKIHVTKQSEVPQLEGFLLDLHAYDQVTELDTSQKGHSHLDSTISTVSIPVPKLEPSKLEKVDKWLRKVLWDRRLPGDEKTALEVHRTKGRLIFDNGDVKLIQGVREIFEIFDSPDQSREAAQTQEGKIILIGRHLKGVDFEKSLVDLRDSST
ncbi:cobW domain-containing protein [Colletotrichum tofieldiae]|nr:cobW domain-containing protein [Colletotrichum tofieldiae]